MIHKILVLKAQHLLFEIEKVKKLTKNLQMHVFGNGLVTAYVVIYGI